MMTEQEEQADRLMRAQRAVAKMLNEERNDDQKVVGRKFMNNISISLRKRQLADSIWKSAGIEGLGTTFPNTECILENLPVQTTQKEVFSLSI